MELPLILPQTLAFSQGELGKNDIFRRAPASLEKFWNFGIGMRVCEENGDSDSSSGCDPTQGNRGQLLGDLDKSLAVFQINKYLHITQGCVSVWTTKSNADYYEQLKKASGGKLFVDIQFELETATGHYKTKVNAKNVEMFKAVDWNRITPGPTGMVFIILERFNVTDSLSEAWRDTGNTFTAKLSVSLRLDEKNAGQFREILSFGEAQNPLVAINKRMQMDTNFTDATLVPGNGKGIMCHKIVLVANSDVFQKKFEATMKEGLTSTVNMPDVSFEGGQALLDYLYCQDTTKASESASLALELLTQAGEYAIEGLEKEMLKLIGAKEKDWFPVGVALQLFEFARNKFENEGLLIYKFVMHKAAVVFKSKSKKEVEESKAFQEFFNNDKSRMVLFTCCMLST